MNKYKKIDLGWNNSLRQFDSVDLSNYSNSSLNFLVLQNSLKNNLFSEILEELWVENFNFENENWKTNIDRWLWRSWFTILETKDYWDVWIFSAKQSSSTEQYSYISDYYLWWTDIWEKVWNIWSEYLEIWRISWEQIWWIKTEILLILSKQTIQNRDLFKNNKDNISALWTKFSPILTNQVLNKMPEELLKPVVIETDSNSELITQILNERFKNTWAIEIVQSWNSLIATETYPVRDWKIYEPSRRDIITWEFNWDIITEVDPSSQLWFIANNIQRPVDVWLYEIENLFNKDKNKSELMEKISENLTNN